MEKISFDLPKINYTQLSWKEEDNVSSNGRSAEFEKQNAVYRKIGFTKYNTTYFRCFEASR